MITQAAKEMLDYLKNMQESAKGSAIYNALKYTETGEQRYQDYYNQSKLLEEWCRKQYSDMRRFAHAIEQEMIEIAKGHQNV